MLPNKRINWNLSNMRFFLSGRGANYDINPTQTPIIHNKKTTINFTALHFNEPPKS